MLRKIRYQIAETCLLVCIMLLFIAALPGCGTKQLVDAETGLPLTPMQKASVLQDELTKEYEFLHRQVSDVLATGTAEQKAWLYQNVTEDLDKAKYLLKGYTDAVILWRSSGQMPADIYEKEQMFRNIFQTILIAFIGR